MSAIISLQNVGVRYKQGGSLIRQRRYLQALSSVSIDIYAGETLGIVGANGAGKSTLLRLISGVIKPNSGWIENRGVSVSLLALQAGFDPNLSGRDNAILSGMLQGCSRKTVENQLEDICEYSELGDFFDRPVRIYSTGMRARLGFSIATIINPDVLLIDEVLGVGDKHFREKAEASMLLKIRSKQTVVIVSHSMAQISRLCDRAVLINGGISCATGEPSEVLEMYDNLTMSAQ